MNIIFALMGLNLIYECPFCKGGSCTQCKLFTPALETGHKAMRILFLSILNYFEYEDLS